MVILKPPYAKAARELRSVIPILASRESNAWRIERWRNLETARLGFVGRHWVTFIHNGIRYVERSEPSENLSWDDVRNRRKALVGGAVRQTIVD